MLKWCLDRIWPSSKAAQFWYRFAQFKLEEEGLRLTAAGKPVRLPRKVIETLCALAERPGELVTKAELMDRLWPDGFVEESNLTQNIYILRRTLRGFGIGKAIETVPRQGYRFVIPVSTGSNSTFVASSRQLRVGGAAILTAAAFFGAMLAKAPAPSSLLDPQSSQLYTLGRYYWSLRTVSALRRSVIYFSEVTRRQPRNALGYAGLSDAYLGLYDYQCDDSPCPRIVQLSKSFAARAVAVDARSAAALTSLAMTHRVFDRSFALSDAEFRRAIALDPNYALAHEWYGNSLLLRGRLAQARGELRTAVELDPISPASYAWLARADYYSHDYRDAIVNAREALSIAPAREESRLLLGLAYQGLGDKVAAASTFRTLHNSEILIAGLWAQGRTSVARATLSQPDDKADIAMDLIALGDYRHALATLTTIHFSDVVQRTFVVLDPRLDPVRSDSRFKAWFRTIGADLPKRFS
jgi:DNA-binding winged helix-turn-helix (wHTH) protein